MVLELSRRKSNILNPKLPLHIIQIVVRLEFNDFYGVQ